MLRSRAVRSWRINDGREWVDCRKDGPRAERVEASTDVVQSFTEDLRTSRSERAVGLGAPVYIRRGPA